MKSIDSEQVMIELRFPTCKHTNMYLVFACLRYTNPTDKTVRDLRRAS